MVNGPELNDSSEAVTHVVPRFSPQIDGVGDYARLLGHELWQRHRIAGRYLIGDPGWRAGAVAGPCEPVALTKRCRAELARRLDGRNRVILHFSGYGYHPRGVPWWLLSGIRQWRSRGGQRLVVVFHELWASGPPWRSEFYLRPFQRRIAADFLRLCNVAITSTPAMVQMLEAIRPGKTILQPIANSLPEVAITQRRWHQRGPVRIAIFGQPATRLASIVAHTNLIRELVHAGLLLGIEVVGKSACAGPHPSEDVQRLLSIVPANLVNVAGDVSPQAGAERMAMADLFLSSYPSRLIGKSSALTAALACGCVPVLREGSDRSLLHVGREFLSCDGSPASIDNFINHVRTAALGTIGQAGSRWQATHASWAGTADRIFRQMLAPAA